MPLILSAFPVHLCLPLPRLNHGHLSSACLTLSGSASTLSDPLTRSQIKFHAQICPIFFLAGSLKFLTTLCHFSPHRPEEWKNDKSARVRGLLKVEHVFTLKLAPSRQSSFASSYQVTAPFLTTRGQITFLPRLCPCLALSPLTDSVLPERHELMNRRMNEWTSEWVDGRMVERGLKARA